MQFWGYKRKEGRAGIRNHVWVCQVNCVWLLFLHYFRKPFSVSYIEMVQRFRPVAYWHRPFLLCIRYCYPYHLQRTLISA